MAQDCVLSLFELDEPGFNNDLDSKKAAEAKVSALEQ